MEIFYKAKKRCDGEGVFAGALAEAFQAKVRPEHYKLPDGMPLTLKTDHALKRLRTQLPPCKSGPQLREHIQNLPPTVKIYTSIKRVNCDVVIVSNGRAHFIEYHEDQHRNLKDARSRKIFTEDGEAIMVPRYVQRYLRDIWRIEHLHPLTIMWEDQFERVGLKGFELAESGVIEHSHRFALTQL
ncbi:MAG: hypothetical protein MK052_05905 [Alphaproteobacteria bacterium]|nr:hypothetical protein [Alphaproteobacteria bacterium]